MAIGTTETARIADLDRMAKLPPAGGVQGPADFADPPPLRAHVARCVPSPVPTLACPAHALAGAAASGFAAGMDDYIAKPAEMLPLGAKLARWLPIPGVLAAAAPLV